MAKKLTKEKQVLVDKVTGFEQEALLILFQFGVIMDNKQKAKASSDIAEMIRTRIKDMEVEIYTQGQRK